MANRPFPQLQPRSTLWGDGLFSPLSWAAYITWLAVVLQLLTSRLPVPHGVHGWLGALALMAFIALFAIHAWTGSRGIGSEAMRLGNVLLQSLCVLGAVLMLRKGGPGILLIVVAGQLPGLLKTQYGVAWLLAINGMLALIWHPTVPWQQWLPSVLSLMGFQAFAMLATHYALRAEHARDDLARVNAELVATRDLLTQLGRSEERLRLSRELHDLTGHKLTALKLNLRAIARHPGNDARDMRVVSMLTDELLDDLRGVVGEMRRHEGIDLRQGLHALATSMRGRRIDLQMQDDLRIADLASATALLRCAQEAVTNAIRHGDAQRITISCQRDGDSLCLRVRDDGRATRLPQPGNGLQGMQERLQQLGGDLEIALADAHGLLLTIRLPQRHGHAVHA